MEGRNTDCLKVEGGFRGLNPQVLRLAGRLTRFVALPGFYVTLSNCCWLVWIPSFLISPTKSKGRICSVTLSLFSVGSSAYIAEGKRSLRNVL